jgi:hypothetical protein
MTDQINAFESDPQVNELSKRKVKVSGESLYIKGQGTISIKLA